MESTSSADFLLSATSAISDPLSLGTPIELGTAPSMPLLVWVNPLANDSKPLLTVDSMRGPPAAPLVAMLGASASVKGFQSSMVAASCTSPPAVPVGGRGACASTPGLVGSVGPAGWGAPLTLP